MLSVEVATFASYTRKEIFSVLGNIQRCSEEDGHTVVEILTVVVIPEHR
jgi:hypothetical protein